MHPNPLEEIIKDRIRDEGPITFASFMDMALYHPERGYYVTSPLRWGPAGDYYTSPGLHPYFGRLLAVQLDEMRSLMDKPDPFTVLELGAGDGRLAAAVIAGIEQLQQWRGNWQYVLIEKNPLAIERQRSLLRDFIGRVAWKPSLEQVAPVAGCILSNELLDAFAVHRICMQDRFKEIYVDRVRNRLGEHLGELSSGDLADYIDRYRIPAVHGYRTEINLNAKNFLNQAEKALLEGFLITIDYGYAARRYYAPERNTGTLLCYYRHTVNHDPYRRIGRQDISAHVNFSSLKHWGEAGELRTLGYNSQGAFLASLAEASGAMQFEEDAMPLPERLKIKNLLLDAGATHRVMIQYKGRRMVERLKGFAISNRMQSL